MMSDWESLGSGIGSWAFCTLVWRAQRGLLLQIECYCAKCYDRPRRDGKVPMNYAIRFRCGVGAAFIC